MIGEGSWLGDCWGFGDSVGICWFLFMKFIIGFCMWFWVWLIFVGKWVGVMSVLFFIVKGIVEFNRFIVCVCLKGLLKLIIVRSSFDF